MSTQATDLPQLQMFGAPPEAQEGMQQAIDHADPRWVEAVKGCVFSVAQKFPEITVDDVWRTLEAVNAQRQQDGEPLFDTHNNSAIGPVMKLCVGLDYIKWTPQMIRSNHNKQTNHGNVRRVWHSKLYRRMK